MKTIILIRHAKSSWDFPDLSDFDRPLNKRGANDAPMMGKRLRKFRVEPDLIVSSPAKRAYKTAKSISRELGYPKDKILLDDTIYEADLSDLLRVVQGLDNALGIVMIFGHNPGFTLLANFLAGTPVTNIPTCGIFCIDFDLDSWKEIGEKKGILKFFDYPKKHNN